MRPTRAAIKSSFAVQYLMCDNVIGYSVLTDLWRILLLVLLHILSWRPQRYARSRSRSWSSNHRLTISDSTLGTTWRNTRPPNTTFSTTTRPVGCGPNPIRSCTTGFWRSGWGNLRRTRVGGSRGCDLQQGVEIRGLAGRRGNVIVRGGGRG